MIWFYEKKYLKLNKSLFYLNNEEDYIILPIYFSFNAEHTKDVQKGIDIILTVIRFYHRYFLVHINQEWKIVFIEIRVRHNIRYLNYNKMMGMLDIKCKCISLNRNYLTYSHKFSKKVMQSKGVLFLKVGMKSATVWSESFNSTEKCYHVWYLITLMFVNVYGY